MKKAPATKKTAGRKNAVDTKTATVAKDAAATSTSQSEADEQQPQSKQQAATEAGLFLYTDDKWSTAYFDPKDLHCEERELFG